MRRLIPLLALSMVLVATPSIREGAEETDKKKDENAAHRQEIDAEAKATLDRLFKESPKAKGLYDKAHGYAVFDNVKFAFGLSGGGGGGVAVDKKAGKRTYMKMGTAGLALGLGGQKYQVVFLFEDAKTFTNFVEKGWQAEAGATAAAGTAAAEAEATFMNGMAFYQLTESGLMLSADITGTKYWKNKKLN
jgi:lipid-binding SYLF domain-containing protein